MAVLNGFALIGNLVILFNVLTGSVVSQVAPLCTQHAYNFENVVQLSAIKSQEEKSSYRVNGQLTAKSVWSTDDQQIIAFKLDSLILKVLKNDRYSEAKSARLANWNGHTFYVLFRNQIAPKLYTSGQKSLQNFEKAFASLFLINFKDNVVVEEDISGSCKVIYQKLSTTKLKKLKTACSKWDLPLHRRSERPLDIDTTSYQEVDYKFSQDGILLDVLSREQHLFKLTMNPTLGTAIESTLSLKLSKSTDLVDSDPDTNMRPEILSSKYIESNLEAEAEESIRFEHKKSSIVDLVNLNRNGLSNEKLGTKDLALIFTKLLPIVRQASSEQLVQLMQSEKNAGIRGQLLDLLGAAQFDAGFVAVTTVFKFTRDEDLPYLEKYLQALTLAARPNENITRNLLQLAFETKLGVDGMRESILLALCSMAHKLIDTSRELHMEIRSRILMELSECDSGDCKVLYVRCIQNLKDPSTIGTLLQIAIAEDRILSVAALKALRSFAIELITSEHRSIFERIFFATSETFDSSSRTLALDFLLEMKPTSDQLTEILKFLIIPNQSFEIKTYLLQKLQMISSQSPEFEAVTKNLLKTLKFSSNYNIMAQGGLSTVLSREYSIEPSFNGTLLSTQEVSKGILKRGLVEMKMTANDKSANIFTLGLYSSGLSSLVGESSNDGDESNVLQNEDVTASMEISVLGNQLRPLVLFTGQGELMGHIWSGTASEPTSAYEATFQLHDHEEYITLQNGATLYLQVVGANSIHLSGFVQFSLWNRNAHTEISKRSGLAVRSTIEIDSFFASLTHDFVVTIEPHIDVAADLDFYSGNKLCIKLNRAKNNINTRSKLLHAIDSSIEKNEAKKSMTSNYTLPGFTLAINRKNNEMCNIIFS